LPSLVDCIAFGSAAAPTLVLFRFCLVEFTELQHENIGRCTRILSGNIILCVCCPELPAFVPWLQREEGFVYKKGWTRGKRDRQRIVRQFDFKHGEAQQAVLRGAYLTGHNENDLHCFLAACRAAERHRQVVAPKMKMWIFLKRPRSGKWSPPNFIASVR
jgi:hypothetical protein